MHGWTNTAHDLYPRSRSRLNTNPFHGYIRLITSGVGVIQSRERTRAVACREGTRKGIGTCYALSFEANSLRNLTTFGATIAAQYP